MRCSKVIAEDFVENDEEVFDYFWELKTAWFEPPNQRRGGWSGVIRENIDINGRTIPVFIKRQENHLTRSLRHCLKGIPTFQKEYKNILRLQRLGIPTLDPIYFGRRDGKAILVTQALDNFQSLSDLQRNRLPPSERKALLHSIANVIRSLHQHHLLHNSLYPKHVFVRQHSEGQWESRLIDLESLRRYTFKQTALLRDLSSLYRHSTSDWTMTDCMRFFKAYLGLEKLHPQAKSLWYKLALKSAAKRR